MEHLGESIYDARGGGYPETANLPVTVKELENDIYLHAFPDFSINNLVKAMKKKLVKAVLLRTGNEINFQYEDEVLRLSVPGKLYSRQVDTVKVYLE